jgi:hypothetical protein
VRRALERSRKQGLARELSRKGAPSSGPAIPNEERHTLPALASRFGPSPDLTGGPVRTSPSIFLHLGFSSMEFLRGLNFFWCSGFHFESNWLHKALKNYLS